MKALWIFCLTLPAALPLTAGTTADFNFTNQTPTCSPACSSGIGLDSALGGSMIFSGYSQSSPIGGTQGGSITDTVRITAWETPVSGGTNSTENLQAAYAGYYAGYGLGVCTGAEGGSNCAVPDHQIDNSTTDYEFMEFQFSTAVDISQIQLVNFGTNESRTNMSSTVWSSSSALDPASTSLATLNSSDNAQTFTCSNDGTSGSHCSTNETWGLVSYAGFGNQPTVDLAESLSDVTTLIIAAKIGDTGSNSDFFKVQDIVAQTHGAVTQGQIATPEPGSFGLIGLALVCFGLFRRKARQNSPRAGSDEPQLHRVSGMGLDHLRRTSAVD